MMEYNWDQYGNERLLSRNKLLFVHHQQAHDILLRHLATLDTAVPVLDIGCGDGFYLEMFRNLGFTNLAGLDPSASQISKAREKNLPVTIGRVEDLENTGHPLCSKSYGIILLWDLLEHVEHPDRALQIAHTLLAPGGSLVVNTVVNDSVWSRLRRFLKKETRLQQTQRVDPSHIVAFTKKSAEMLVLQAGFRILQSMRIGNRWPYFSKKNFRWLSRWTVFGLFGDALTLIAVR